MKGPIIIGGIGGSGTRLIAGIIKHAGVYVGKKSNGTLWGSSNDCKTLHGWYLKYADKALKGFDEVECGDIMKRDLFKLIKQFLEDIETDIYGWKLTSSILYIKFFNDIFDNNFKFIHLIRDGRDMAISKNRGMYRDYCYLLNDKYDDETIGKAMLWSKLNLYAYVFGPKYLGKRYLLVRYEDLCNKSKIILKKISELIEKPLDIDIYEKILKPENSIGRYKKLEQQKIDEIESKIKYSLVKFGYMQC